MTINIINSYVPTTSTSTGTKGDVIVGDDYIYKCIETNTWVRTPLMTW
jgi:hypothetical protein